MNDQRQPNPFTDTLSVEDALDLIDRGIPAEDVLRTYDNISAETREVLAVLTSLERERGLLEPPRELLRSALRAMPPQGGVRGLMASLSKFKRPLAIAVPAVVFAALLIAIVPSLTNAPAILLQGVAPSAGFPGASETPETAALKESAPSASPAPAAATQPSVKSGMAAALALNPIDAAVAGIIDEGRNDAAAADAERAAELATFDADEAARNALRGLPATLGISTSTQGGADFCASVSSTAGRASALISEHFAAGDAALLGRSQTLREARSASDSARTAGRAAADAPRFGSLDGLIQEEQGTNKRSALQTFRNDAMASLSEARDRIDAARKAVREGVDDAIAVREGRYRSARTKFSNAVRSAFAAAKQACAKNPKSSTAQGSLRKALDGAENQFVAATAAADEATSVSEAVQAEQDALRSAVEELAAAVRAAQSALRDALND